MKSCSSRQEADTLDSIVVKPFSVEHAIGNTPLVEVTSLNPNPRVRILAKMEGNNPGGSIKDRPAYYMIAKAEESGELTPDKIILEATSGNTGIALAMIGAARKYRVKLAMPACVSLERRSILEAYGAEVVLSPAHEATDGAIRLAHQILEENPGMYYMPNQYANENNVLAHYETTGPEIFRPDRRQCRHLHGRYGNRRDAHGCGTLSERKKPEYQDHRCRTADRPQDPGTQEHEGSDRSADLP